MSTLKRLIIVSVSFGIGFAATLALIIAAFLWYQSQPRPPEPWNTTASSAIYGQIETEGKSNTFVFYYTLKNNTDFDYKISNLSDVVTMIKLENPNSLSGSPNDEYLKPDYPILIPAKQSLRLGIHLKYPSDIKLKTRASKEDRKDHRKELEKYVNQKFSNLAGFVIFDEINRYQINLPCGWKK